MPSTRTKATSWLAARARTGVHDLPGNAAWLLSKALQPAEDAGATVRDAASNGVGSVTAGASSLGSKVSHLRPGNPVDRLTADARAAAEEAQDAESDAVAAAERARSRSDEARSVAEDGRRHVSEVERSSAEQVEQRVREAEQRAAAMVDDQRQAAEADAAATVQSAAAEAESRAQAAEETAERAHEEARDQLEAASESLRRARELADEAAQAAELAAQKARAEARRLAGEADDQAQEAQERVDAADRTVGRTASIAEHTTADLTRPDIDEDLDTLTKKELLTLAGSLELEGRTGMTKGDLVTALRSKAGTR